MIGSGWRGVYMAKILVVEDDRSLREALVYNLRREQYTPIAVGDATSVVDVVRREKPDLIILDLMLPGGSGFDVCRDLRAFSRAPVIMLTARGEDVDRVLGLEMGADDYVTKPFSLRELLARVRANLRRVSMDQEEAGESVLEYGPLRIVPDARTVELHGQRLSLQPKEFDLLYYFAQHPGVALRRDRLLSTVWGHEYVGPRTVDVHVRRLRAKLDRHGASDLIGTIHGVGYTFAADQPLPESATQADRRTTAV